MKQLRQTSDMLPEALLIINNNTYYYNHDIQEEHRDVSSNIDINDEAYADLDPMLLDPANWPETVYTYIPIEMKGTPNYNDIVKKVIRVYISAEEEFDLINSYNRSILFKEIDDNVKYIKYLQLLESIKQEVRKGLNSYNAIHDTHY